METTNTTDVNCESNLAYKCKRSSQQLSVLSQKHLMRFKSQKILMICKTYCLLDDFVICRWLRWSTSFFRWSLPRGTAACNIRIRPSVLNMLIMAAMSARSCSVGDREERRRQRTDLEERRRMVLVGLSGLRGLPAQGLAGRAFRCCHSTAVVLKYGYFDNIPWP